MNRLCAILLTLLLAAASTAAADRPVRVTVSILPQEWLVKAVGGDEVEVMVLVGPGHSPATYEPTASQMARLLESEVFFSAGVPFENGLLRRIAGRASGPVVRGPRPAGGSGHSDLDPHGWLSLDGAVAMIDTVRAALSDVAPAAAARWLPRASEAKHRVLAAHDRARDILAGCAGREFFVFHPAFGHFARDHGLVQVAVEDHGHEPGPRHLAELIERAKASGAKAIVVQPQFSRKSAEAVAGAVGAEIVVLDPLAADLPGNILHIAGKLAGILDCEQAP